MEYLVRLHTFVSSELEQAMAAHNGEYNEGYIGALMQVKEWAEETAWEEGVELGDEG